jgi:inorganic pyrophosphatase
MKSKSPSELSAFGAESKELNVIIETPKRSRNKFNYDEESGLFKLGGVLPAGAFFPFDFGFVPSTLGGDGETTRNDRLIAVAAHARTHGGVRSLDDLDDLLLKEIEHFFVSYNEIRGKQFKPLGRFGPARAAEVVEQGVELFRRKRRASKRKSPSKSKARAKKR